MTKTNKLNKANGLMGNLLMNLKDSVPAAGSDYMGTGKPDMSLREFIKQSWHVIEPGRTYVDGWHIGAIVEHLEAVSTGQIQRLLINMPPRHMKSLSVSVCWPAWEWTFNPWIQFFFSSYSATLSVRDNMKTREIVTSPWYQEAWPHVELKRDQNAKDKFENKAGGFRFSTSVGGRATGEGGDRIVADDPHNMSEVKSDAKRKEVLDWWDNTMQTRLNDPKTGAFVVVMQRGHQQDLSGHILEKGGYVHLCLPARYEGNKFHTVLGFEDPRTEEGELLWPERFDEVTLSAIEDSFSSKSEAAGQLQQRPSPAGGAIFKLDWFKTYTKLPKFYRIVEHWDTAQKANIGSAYSCGQIWAEAHNGYYLLDVIRKRMEYPELKRTIKTRYAVNRPDVVVIEDKSSGISVIQDLQESTTVPVVAWAVTGGDKENRAKAVADTIESGNVWLPESAEWLADFLDEIEHFPGSKFKDQVDVMTQAIEYFKRRGGLTEGRDMS